MTPISQMHSWTFGFAVPAASPSRTFADFIAAARADRKLAFYASPSSGSAQHLLGLQLGDTLTERISKSVRDALSDPQVRAKFLQMGVEPLGSTPLELDAYDRSELERWRGIVKGVRLWGRVI